MMLARPYQLASQRLCKTTCFAWRNQNIRTGNCRYVKSFSHGVQDAAPLNSSFLGSSSWSSMPWRGISYTPSRRSKRLELHEDKSSSKPAKPHRRQINVANLIESVFENKVKTKTVPDGVSTKLRGYKDVRSYPNSNRRRVFLLDSAEYRSSSLEIFKVQEQSYDEDDHERIKSFVKDVSRKLSSYSSSEVMDILSSLSRAPESKISSDFFSVALLDLSTYACQHASDCTDEQFCKNLLALYKMHASLSHEQRANMEEECKKRLPQWDVNTMFLVSDWWISIRQKPLTFHMSALNTLSTRVEELTVQNVVQVFYLIGEWQYVPSEDFLQKLNDFVEQHLESLSWNEIGVICNAFLKSRSRILSRSLQRAISPRVSRDLQSNDLDHYNLISIMRFLSRAYFHDWHLFEEMARTLTPQIKHMPFLVPPHVAAAFAKVRHFNQPLMDAIAGRALQTADYIRFKDIWMLLWAFCRLNYHPPNSREFFQGLIHQMLGKPEQLAQPYLFLKSLVSLTFIEQYPTVLIDKAFSPDCLRNCQEQCPPDVFKLLYVLDCSVAIEHPDYHGNRLPQELINKFWQSPHGSTKDLYNKIPGLERVMEGLHCILGGAQYLKAHPILPHIRTPLDIEVHLDNASQPMSMESVSSRKSCPTFGTENPKDDRQRLAVLVSPRAHYRLRSRDLLGVHVMKRRQLGKIGYRIVEIPFYEWDPLIRASEGEQQDYLRDKIFNSC